MTTENQSSRVESLLRNAVVGIGGSFIPFQEAKAVIEECEKSNSLLEYENRFLKSEMEEAFYRLDHECKQHEKTLKERDKLISICEKMAQALKAMIMEANDRKC